jgi:hypothetical protein
MSGREETARNRLEPTFAVGLEVRTTDSDGGERGRGLFLVEPVRRAQVILTFGGRLLSKAEYGELAEVDHCLQIGPATFLGPSGDMDDFTNHSCAPSARVEVERGSNAARLVALGDLASGAEVCFDYSTVQLDDPRFILAGCRCGSPTCRGEIGDFRRLALGDQQRLVEAGWCVWYVEDAFWRDERRRRGQGGSAR